MRLAFAVAAHIEPEILLIDEVLAVGDADFQKKSIQRVEQIGRRGQVVLLFPTISRLFCGSARSHVFGSRKGGELWQCGRSDGKLSENRRRESWFAAIPRRRLCLRRRYVRLRGVRIRDPGTACETVDIGTRFGIEIEFEVLESGTALFPSITIHSERGPVLWATDAGTAWHGYPRPAGRYVEVAWITENTLADGVLRVAVAVSPSVLPGRTFRARCRGLSCGGNRRRSRGRFTGSIESAVRPLLEWTLNMSNDLSLTGAMQTRSCWREHGMPKGGSTRRSRAIARFLRSIRPFLTPPFCWAR